MQRLLKVDHDQFNVLKLLPASREVLKGERQLILRRSTARVARRGRQRTGAATPGPGKGSVIGAGANVVLFEALREWRRTTAREHNVPAYTVFHDSTLAEIARQLPQSALQLRAIAGVGQAKLARYGAALLDLVLLHTAGHRG